MYSLSLTADQLVCSLLRISENENVCVLDSCGVGDSNSNRLLAGIRPKAVLEISNEDPQKTLEHLDDLVKHDDAVIFSVSYDFGENFKGFHRYNPQTSLTFFLSSLTVLSSTIISAVQRSCAATPGVFAKLRIC